MITAGVFLKGNEARLISLKGERQAHVLLATKINKLAIPKAPTQLDIQIFADALLAYCAQWEIERLVINRRATTGQGAGGAGTFILEGVFLSLSPVPIEFVHPATLRATDKRCAELKSSRPKTQDLGKAYDLAFEALV